MSSRIHLHASFSDRVLMKHYFSAEPNVTTPSKIYLELHDEEGTTATSPPFSLRRK